jgi:hypothetical protein
MGSFSSSCSQLALNISMYPLNLIGIYIRCAHFHGSGQVDDYLTELVCSNSRTYNPD